jgi:hypothetical protein
MMFHLLHKQSDNKQLQVEHKGLFGSSTARDQLALQFPVLGIAPTKWNFSNVIAHKICG